MLPVSDFGAQSLFLPNISCIFTFWENLCAFFKDSRVHLSGRTVTYATVLSSVRVSFQTPLALVRMSIWCKSTIYKNHLLYKITYKNCARAFGARIGSVIFKENIARECHFARASVVLMTVAQAPPSILGKGAPLKTTYYVKSSNKILMWPDPDTIYLIFQLIAFVASLLTPGDPGQDQWAARP